MDFKNFQDQQISHAVRFGVDLDFYCKFSIKKVAQKFSAAVGGEVIIVPDDDGFIPEQGKFYIKEGFNYGSERYSFISAPLPYTHARALFIRVLLTIKEYCYTNETCVANINLTYDTNLIKELDIRKLNPLKFILEFNEDMVWRFFPDQKNSIYVKSIKTIIPQNKFFRSENLKIESFNYILPDQPFFGVIFNDIKDGFIQMRYIGGKDYEYKVVEALDVIGIFNSFVSRCLFDPSYNAKNKKELKSIIKNADKILKGYASYESFVETFPDIKLTVDMGDDVQHIKTFFPKFRDQLFDLLASSDLNKGEVNYDAAMSHIQIRHVKLHIYEVKDWEFIDSELIIESGRECSFFGCKIESSSLTSCNIYRFSSVKNSRLKDTYINRTCEVTNTYIYRDLSTIDGTVKGGLIKGGRVGNHSHISKETELIDYSKIYTK